MPTHSPGICTYLVLYVRLYGYHIADEEGADCVARVVTSVCSITLNCFFIDRHPAPSVFVPMPHPTEKGHHLLYETQICIANTLSGKVIL